MKKLIAILIATLMLISLIPVNAIALEVENEHLHDASCDHACPGQGEEHTKDNCDWTLYKVVESKCGELGYTLYLCVECGDYFAADFDTIPGNHNYVKVNDAKDPTCTDKGYEEKWACSECGRVDPAHAGTVINELGHDWETISKTGNCLEGGTLTEKCSRCDLERTTPIAGTGEGHNYDQYPVSYIAPTCKNRGSATFVCRDCGNEKVVPILTISHTYVIDEAVDPTCTGTGLTEGKHCSVCGEIEVAQHELPALGHDWVYSNVVGATCTEKGSYTQACDRCGLLEEKEEEALGHDWSEWTTTLEPTCTTLGLEERVCRRDGCGEGEVRVIDKKPHSYADVPTEVIDPTCTTWGLKIYYCINCGYLKDPVDADKIKPLGHTSFDDPISTHKDEILETCESNGERFWKCGRCRVDQHSVVDNIEGHNEVSVIVKANCHVYSYTFTYCTNDCCTLPAVPYKEVNGVNYNTEVEGNPVRLVAIEVGDEYDPDNHDSITLRTNEPTCTEKGSKVLYCPYCDYTYLTAIDALGHDFDTTIAGNVVVLIPETCLTNRVSTVKCSRCDETKDIEIENTALGHTRTPVEKKDSTCTETGYEAYLKCDRCDWTEGFVVIDKKPHTYTSVVYAPTCLYDGYTLHTCENCGYWYIDSIVPYEYDPIYEYESFEAAKLVHPNLDPATKQALRTGDCYLTSLDTYYCPDCGKTIHVIADLSTGHHLWNEENPHDAGRAPTCTEYGYKPIYECSRCHNTKGGEPINMIEHHYLEATCTAPQTCEMCGATKGEALGHTWIDANCTTPKTCSVCGETDGEALGHTWIEANCTTAKTCSVCGETEGVALGHDLIADYVYTADCTHIGFIYYSCRRCEDVSVDFLGSYAAELGHNYRDVIEVDSTCCTEGHTSGSKCNRCGDWETEIEIIPVKDYHQNVAGEKLRNECTNLCDDRFCVWCLETIGQDHTAIFTITLEPDCNSEGYTLEVCSDCNYEKVIDYVPMRNVHDWSDWERVVEPTFTNVGKETRFCRCCAREGIEIVEEREVPALAGIELIMSADNADKSGAGFTDSSLVALTIDVDSVKTDVWGMMFNVNYSDNMKFVSAEFAVDNALIANQIVVDNNGFVSIAAFAPNTDTKELQNVTIEGDMAFVTLYFRVVNGEVNDIYANANFSISNCDVIDIDGNMKAVRAEECNIEICTYMDFNRDGDVTLQDVLAANKILTGELTDAEGNVVTYDVALDIDKDGEITAADLLDILCYMNGSKSYVDVTES